MYYFRRSKHTMTWVSLQSDVVSVTHRILLWNDMPDGSVVAEARDLFASGAKGPHQKFVRSRGYLVENWTAHSAIVMAFKHDLHTMRFGSTAKVLLKCKLKYYRISECCIQP